MRKGGYDLFQELNVQKRGATALLNARLLPVMEDFFDSIEGSLAELGLDLPIVIVKSDGSIMSREFAMSRPVETLLCGPAASIIGAMELSKYQDALIVDMGGTTSDVAMVKDGIPVTSEWYFYRRMEDHGQRRLHRHLCSGRRQCRKI